MVKLHYPLYWHCDILKEPAQLSPAEELDEPQTRKAKSKEAKREQKVQYIVVLPLVHKPRGI